VAAGRDRAGSGRVRVLRRRRGVRNRARPGERRSRLPARHRYRVGRRPLGRARLPPRSRRDIERAALDAPSRLVRRREPADLGAAAAVSTTSVSRRRPAAARLVGRPGRPARLRQLRLGGGVDRGVSRFLRSGPRKPRRPPGPGADDPRHGCRPRRTGSHPPERTRGTVVAAGRGDAPGGVGGQPRRVRHDVERPRCRCRPGRGAALRIRPVRERAPGRRGRRRSRRPGPRRTPRHGRSDDRRHARSSRRAAPRDRGGPRRGSDASPSKADRGRDRSTPSMRDLRLDAEGPLGRS
jgi:hypothetical protein